MRGSILIDSTPISVVGVCPTCSHREFGSIEWYVRLGLLEHLKHEHPDCSQAGQARRTMSRWFQRRGVKQ